MDFESVYFSSSVLPQYVPVFVRVLSTIFEVGKQ